MLVERAETLGLPMRFSKEAKGTSSQKMIFSKVKKEEVILGPVGMTKCLLSEQT